MSEPFHLGHVTIARHLPTRIAGLMGKGYVGSIPMLFPRCSSLHTWFMKVPVDIVCLDEHDRIVRILEKIAPWRVVFGGRKTKSMLELPAGYAQLHRLIIGEYVEYDEWKG